MFRDLPALGMILLRPKRIPPDIGRVLNVSPKSSGDPLKSLIRPSLGAVLVEAKGVDLRSPGLKLLVIKLLPPNSELVLLFRGSGMSRVSLAAGLPREVVWPLKVAADCKDRSDSAGSTNWPLLPEEVGRPEDRLSKALGSPCIL
jgi:hypothetical protein